MPASRPTVGFDAIVGSAVGLDVETRAAGPAGVVAGWVAGHDAADALARLEAAEVPSCLVMSVRDLFEDPQVRARDDIVRVAAGALGLLAMPGVVPRLTATPGEVRQAGPPSPGEHNEEIYGGRLGLSTAEIGDLRARGIV